MNLRQVAQGGVDRRSPVRVPCRTGPLALLWRQRARSIVDVAQVPLHSCARDPDVGAVSVLWIGVLGDLQTARVADDGGGEPVGPRLVDDAEAPHVRPAAGDAEQRGRPAGEAESDELVVRTVGGRRSQLRVHGAHHVVDVAEAAGVDVGVQVDEAGRRPSVEGVVGRRQARTIVDVCVIVL